MPHIYIENTDSLWLSLHSVPRLSDMSWNPDLCKGAACENESVSPDIESVQTEQVNVLKNHTGK